MKQKTVQWIDITLTKAEKEGLKKAFNDTAGGFDCLSEICADGLKMSLSWDARNECYAVFLIPASDDHINVGCILTARSDEPWKAVFAAWYKHTKVLKKDWRPRGGKKDDDFGDF